MITRPQVSVVMLLYVIEIMDSISDKVFSVFREVANVKTNGVREQLFLILEFIIL